jgi:hypothetical protein
MAFISFSSRKEIQDPVLALFTFYGLGFFSLSNGVARRNGVSHHEAEIIKGCSRVAAGCWKVPS